MSSTNFGKIVDDRDGGLIFPKGRVTRVLLIDRRQQERRLRKNLLSVLARKCCRGTAHRHDEVRVGPVGELGPDIIHGGLFRSATTNPFDQDGLDDVRRNLHRRSTIFTAKDPLKDLGTRLPRSKDSSINTCRTRGWASLEAATSSSQPASAAHRNLRHTPDILAVPCLSGLWPIGPWRCVSGSVKLQGDHEVVNGGVPWRTHPTAGSLASGNDTSLPRPGLW